VPKPSDAAEKVIGPDLFRSGEKTTRLEAVDAIADHHLGILGLSVEPSKTHKRVFQQHHLVLAIVIGSCYVVYPGRVKRIVRLDCSISVVHRADVGSALGRHGSSAVLREKGTEERCPYLDGFVPHGSDP